MRLSENSTRNKRFDVRDSQYWIMVVSVCRVQIIECVNFKAVQHIVGPGSRSAHVVGCLSIFRQAPELLSQQNTLSAE